METYRLGSSQMIHTPGIVRWAINGYRLEPDRAYLRDVIAGGWDISATAAHALLSGAVPYTVEGDTVVFKVAA